MVYLPLSLFIALACSSSPAGAFIVDNEQQYGGDRNLNHLGAACSNLYKVQLNQGERGTSSIVYMSSNGYESEKRKRSVKNLIKFGSRATINLLRGKGRVAVSLLLRDAHEVKKIDRVTWFKKNGGWKRALADFNSVKPNDRKEYYSHHGSYIMEGQVGDRALILSSAGAKNTPRLQIFNKGSGYDIHIVDYMDTSAL